MCPASRSCTACGAVGRRRGGTCGCRRAGPGELGGGQPRQPLRKRTGQAWHLPACATDLRVACGAAVCVGGGGEAADQDNSSHELKGVQPSGGAARLVAGSVRRRRAARNPRKRAAVGRPAGLVVEKGGLAGWGGHAWAPRRSHARALLHAVRIRSRAATAAASNGREAPVYGQAVVVWFSEVYWLAGTDCRTCWGGIEDRRVEWGLAVMRMREALPVSSRQVGGRAWQGGRALTLKQ